MSLNRIDRRKIIALPTDPRRFENYFTALSLVWITSLLFKQREILRQITQNSFCPIVVDVIHEGSGVGGREAADNTSANFKWLRPVL